MLRLTLCLAAALVSVGCLCDPPPEQKAATPANNPMATPPTPTGSGTKSSKSNAVPTQRGMVPLNQDALGEHYKRMAEQAKAARAEAGAAPAPP